MAKKSLRCFLTRFASAFFVVALISITIAPQSFAAANDYTVSGGDPGSLPTVGAASVALSTIAIVDVGGDDFTNDPENIDVAINTAAYTGVEFDQTVAFGSLTAAGTCGYNTVNSVTYTSATTARVAVAGGTNCANAETITIAGLKVLTTQALTAPGAAALVTVDNATTASGSAVASSTTVNYSITAADAAASIVRGTATTGSNSLALTIASPRALIVGDKINITFPSSFTVANGTDVVAGSITNNNSGTSTLVTTAAGQILTLTVATSTLTDADGGAAAHVITIPGNNAIADYVDTTDVTTFTIQTSGSVNIATDSAVALTDITAADAAATVVKADSVLNSTGNLTLAFTLPASVPTTSKIDITFPSYYTIAASSTAIVAGSITGTCQGGSSTMTLSAPGSNVMRLTVGGATLLATDCSVVIAGSNAIPNGTGSTDITSFVIERTGGEDIATDSAVALTDVGGGSGGSSDTTAPAVPTNIKATLNSANQVVLTWTDPGDSDLAKVEILRGISPAPVSGTPLDTVAKGTQTYTDKTVVIGDNVAYILRVRDGNDNSRLSAEFTIKIVAATTSTTSSTTTTTTTPTTTTETKKEETKPVSTTTTTISDAVKALTSVAEKAGVSAEVIQTVIDKFKDVTASDWSVGFIARAQKDGILAGDAGKDTIRPNDNANRAELAKIAAKAFGKEAKGMGTFSDVESGAWYAPFVAAVQGAGLKGYADGTFAPGKSVNRAEALVMLLTVAGVDTAAADVSKLTFSDVTADSWYAKAIAWAVSQGVVSGKTDTTFDPAGSITRAEIAKLTVLIKDVLKK